MSYAHHPTRHAALPLAILSSSLLIAACGSSSSSSSQAGASARAAASPPSSRAACLKKHGVTPRAGGPGQGAPPGAASAGKPPAGAGSPPAVPAPSGGGAPSASGPGSRVIAPNQKLQPALQACGSALPAAPHSGAAYKQSIVRYVDCIRRHGYQLPDPNLSGHGSVLPSNIQSDPKFQTASRSCQGKLVAPGAPDPAGAMPAG